MRDNPATAKTYRALHHAEIQQYHFERRLRKQVCDRHLCPTCGNEITFPVWESLGKPKVTFGPIQLRLLKLLQTTPGGLSKDALMSRLYTEGNEPTTGDKLISIHVVSLNKRLALMGLKISGDGGLYRFIRWEPPTRHAKKLSDAQVKAIRVDTRAQAEIARAYEVSRQHVSQIISGTRRGQVK